MQAAWLASWLNEYIDKNYPDASSGPWNTLAL